ncbi:hypothetical protein GF325_13590 [Candidatus Bathyarchaeota archaeon]|nr:hypothetical protein [Candidatus Bathyarchaeota archaeon]
MISIQQPKDLIAIAVHNILSYRANDPTYLSLVTRWKRKIIIILEPFYPLAIIFDNGAITFQKKEDTGADLIIRLSIETMLDLAFGRMNLLKALVSRKLKIKKLYKIPTLIRFYRVFFQTVKMMAVDPNTDHFTIFESRKVEVV